MPARRLLALLAGLAVATGFVIAAETQQRGLRFSTVELIYDPPGVSWTMRADASWDGRGWRADLPPTAPVPGMLRLVAVGDSVTWGVSVRPDEAWPERVGARLGLDVVNLGMNGWDASQVAALTEAVAADWRPTVLVWGAYINDGLRTRVLYTAEDRVPVYVGTEVPEAGGLASPRLGALLLRHSAVFRRLQGAAWVQNAHGRERPFDAPWFDAQLDRVVAWSRRERVPLVVAVLAPHVFANMSTCPQEFREPTLCAPGLEAYRHIAAAAAARGVPVADTLDALQRSGKSAFHPRSKRDPDHPGAQGHEIYARAIAPVVAGVLPSHGKASAPDAGRRAPEGPSSTTGPSPTPSAAQP